MSVACPDAEVTTQNHATVGGPDPAFKYAASPYLRWSSAWSRVGAFVLLLPALPLLAVLVVLIRTTSRGPAIFRQTRVGLDGRCFTIFKLRTMRQDAEALTGPVWATQSDPRTTAIGAVLRRLHLDELPQLFNVLRGEMTLIGPRPERPEFTVDLAEQLPTYRQRLAIRPGITGLAQVCLPADVDVESVREKLFFDLRYVREASLRMDAYIVIRTSLRMVGIRADIIGWLSQASEVTLDLSDDETIQAQNA